MHMGRWTQAGVGEWVGAWQGKEGSQTTLGTECPAWSDTGFRPMAYPSPLPHRETHTQACCAHPLGYQESALSTAARRVLGRPVASGWYDQSQGGSGWAQEGVMGAKEGAGSPWVTPRGV